MLGTTASTCHLNNLCFVGLELDNALFIMHHNKVSVTGATIGSNDLKWANVSTGDIVSTIATVSRAWNSKPQQCTGQISHNQPTAHVLGQLIIGYL